MADRIEREIEEILRKLDNFVPDSARRPARRMRQPFTAAQSWLAHRLARISLNQVMMWALIAFLVTFFFRAIPGASWIMIAALIVFVSAFLLSRVGGSRPPTTQKRWRGEPIDLSGPSWPDRIKAWLKGRRRV
ncbi:MAG: hypothetical protein GEU75_11075 [Dehalococcoidia bacterium]|nr:hypothetical protein [Dehalococcoidia bacterium]